MKKSETENIEVFALKFTQKGRHMYLGLLNADQVGRMFYIAPNTRDNPDGIQRLIKKPKVDAIAQYIRTQNGILPTSGVLNITKGVTIKKVPGVSDLYRIVFKNVPKKTVEELGNGSFGYFIDHQHTFKGVVQAGKMDLMLPWTFLHNASKNTAWKVFADINSTQTPVNKVTLDRLRYKLWELDTDGIYDNYIVKAIDELNEANNSVLKGKIRAYEDDKGTWVNMPAFKGFLRTPFEEFNRLNLNWNEKRTVLINFYRAISEIYPDAWGDDARKNYVLCKAMGLRIITVAILPVALRRCMAKYGPGNWTKDNFVKEIKGKIQTINLRDSNGDHQIKLDWDRNVFGELSSGKGIAAIIAAIRNVYRER